MRKLRVISTLAIALLLVIGGCTRETVTNNEIIKEISPDNAAYIGSEECGVCHETTYDDFVKTGHPYKLNNAADVAPDTGYYPFSSVPSPPSGVAWTDVTKVIGGFWWKARFIDNDGFIVTGSDVQYNLVDGSWAAYHDGEVKPYDCGPCHMTDYEDVGNQEGLDGLVGTWAFDGVQCEECHGPGELHAASPYDIGLEIDRSSEQCGKCHIRGDVNQIPASGGFIKHHEQWNEMFTTKHQALDCVDCHDPHIGLHPNNPDRDMAIKIKCESCHLDEAESFAVSDIEQHRPGANGAPTCISCHMAKAAKSAKAAGPYEGDVHSHLFRINTDADAEMFSEDGSTANGYLTLEFTCLQCHSTEDKAWAADNAERVHAGSAEFADCFSCHGVSDLGPDVIAATGQWENSQHSIGETIGRNYSSCAGCHTSEGFIENVTGEDYGGTNYNTIGCFTCHDPHESESFAVRTMTEVTLGNSSTYNKGVSNLCANCHKSRRDVTTYVYDGVSMSEHYGPHHGPQSDMLIGENAYEYSGYTYLNSAHTSTTLEGCVDCHFDEADRYVLGGHTFKVTDEESGDEHTDACNVDGCHTGSLEIDTLNRLAYDDYDWDGSTEGIQDEIAGLLDSLSVLLIAGNLLTYDAVEDEYHPVERAVTLADSAGALYNYEFVAEDRSHGIHNTKYSIGLLQSSINYLETGSPGGIQFPSLVKAH